MAGRQFNMRLSDEDHARLTRIAKHLAIAPQDVVRMLVKREADKLPAKGEKKR